MALLIIISLLSAAALFWLLRCVPYLRERRDQEESVYQSALKKQQEPDDAGSGRAQGR